MTLQACTCIWTVRLFTSLQNRVSDFGQYTDIILQGVLPISNHKIQFFVGNQEIKLQSKDNRDWVPMQRQYALRLIPCCVHTIAETLCMQGCFSNIQDTRGDPNEEWPSTVGEEGKD